MVFKIIFTVLLFGAWCYCLCALGFEMCKEGFYKPFIRHKIKKKNNKKEDN